RIVRIDYRRRAVNLYLGSRELEFNKLSATLCELLRAVEDGFSIFPVVITSVDSNRLFRNQSLQRCAIVCEVGAPHGLSRIEQLFSAGFRQLPLYLLLLCHRFGMQLRVAASLNPLAVLFGVEVRNAKKALPQTIGSV